MFQSGGLRLIDRSSFNVAVHEDQWELTCRNGTNGTIKIDGRWDKFYQRGFVDVFSLQKAPGEISTWRFENWKMREDNNQWVAHLATYLNPNGQSYRLTLNSAHDDLPETLEAAFRTPQFNGHDVVRGDLHIGLITDYRATPPIHQKLSTSGIQEIDDVKLRVLYAEKIARLRYAGWCFYGLIVLAMCSARIAHGPPNKGDTRC